MSPPKRAVVLVLDDEESVGLFIRRALPEKSFQTVWRAEPAGALAAVDELQPDVAIVDIELHGPESGWDFLRKLRASPGTERLPVIMLTGSEDTMAREKALRMGADRYLIKPVRPETIRRLVHEILSARDDLWWSTTLTGAQVDQLRELFFDTTTEVPTLALVMADLRRIVESGETLQVICLEVEPLFRTAERDLWEAFDRVRRDFVRGLRVIVAPLLDNEVVIATSHSGANDFYCFARNANGRPITHVARDLEVRARKALRSIAAGGMADEVMIAAGGALTQAQPLFASRVLYNAVREAKDNAERRETRYYATLGERLARTIAAQTIRTVFQPILDLRSRRIVGYEALSRGPAGTDLESPEVLFELARDFDQVWDLEKLCIQNVKPWLDDVCSRGSLFFNLESHFIQQLHYRGTDVFESFFGCREQVVIEVTERSAIRDYRMFRHTLHELKRLGFRIAIDDCGSGYATLEAIAELQPDYLKVGHSLFNGVEHDPIRRRLVELVARCGESIGAKTVAEAIETEEQLRVTQDLGIDHGQGFLFARPAPWEQIARWKPRSADPNG